MKRLRVYLSSTYKDLKEYRDAVFAALEKAGLEVARMEGYTADDKRPLDLCLGDVAQSDIYVGVYAWRYGYEPPAEHGNPDGKSITELEYRKAEAVKKLKLLFLAHPDTQAGWPDRFKDKATGEGERGEKLDRFREQIATDKTVSFFHRPDELATLVLAAIMRSGMSGRAYNIPLLPPGFVPRVKLAKAIVESLVGAEGTFGTSTLVQGSGGFGKTTLAIDACHQAEVVNAFPDGMLWTSLGEKPDLAMILSNLHVLATGSAPAVAGVDQISEALARALAGRRCLVVVDDAWRIDDLGPFLRLDGPRILVTTRIRTLIEQAGQTWAEVPVEEMEVAEAAAILGRGLELEESEESSREALQRFAGRLGCWPLLLGLANARLLEEQKMRRVNITECIDSVVALFERKGVLGFDLRDSRARNTAVARSVKAGLELADEMFPGLTLKAAEISIFPENVAIPEQVLADLWAMEELDVEEEVLRPLDNLSLLRWDREAGNIRLHMMINRVLAALLDKAVGGPAAPHRRLIDAWGDPHRLCHDYAWRWFGWHCAHANEVPRLRRLLFDFDWLLAKLKSTDINALLKEFDYIQGDPQAELVQGALRLSAHVLAGDKSKLAGQLLARVPESEKQWRDRVLERALTTRDFWLRPLWPSLASPGGPLVRTLEGHTSSVNGVALTPDGKHAVSASSDHTLRVWDLERVESLRTLAGHTDSVNAVVLTPDGKCAVSASEDRTLKVWDLERGEALRTLEGHTNRVCAVALTPDGKRAVSASGDNTLKVWDIECGEVQRTLVGHTLWVTAVAITPDGKHAVSTGFDRTVKVWDLERDEALRTFEAHQDAVNAVAISPDGKRAVTASRDHTVKVWDLECGEALRTLEGHTDWVIAVTLTHDGKRAVSASKDHTVRVWNLDRDEAPRMLEGHTNRVYAVALTRDGKRAVSASWDRTLKVWDIGGESLRTLKWHKSRVNAVTLTPNGKRAMSASEDRTLNVWDLDSVAPILTLVGHADSVKAVAMTPDGRRAVSAGANDTLKIWDLESGEALRTLQGHINIGAVALTPEGKRAISASSEFTLKIWDVEGGEALSPVEVHFGPVSDAHLWPHFVNAVALTPDGKRVVSTDLGRTLNVWGSERGEPPRTLEGHTSSVNAVAITPDGKRAVSASEDSSLKVWDLGSGELLRTLVGLANTVNAVAITPGGKHVVSANQDGTVAVWNCDTGQFVASFRADSPVLTAAAAQDGRTIVAGDEEGRVHFLFLENSPGE